MDGERQDELSTEQPAVESNIEIAARSINGTLKRPVFQKFINYASWLLGSPPSTVSDEMLCVGSFLTNVFKASSDKERAELAIIVQDAHMMIRNLFDVICSIWAEDVVLSSHLYEEVLALFRLLLHSLKANQLREKFTNFCSMVIVALQAYSKKDDTFKSVHNALLQYCLEFVCINVDHSLPSGVSPVESQILFELCTSQNSSVCLLAKAIVGLLNTKGQISDLTHVDLSDQELYMLLETLQPNSSISLYVSECTLPIMLRGLRTAQQNVDKFQLCNIDSLLEKKFTHDVSPALSIDPSTEESSVTSNLTDLEQERASVVHKNTVVETVEFLAQFLATLMARHDLPDKPPLCSADFDNCTACLLLIEQLKSEASEDQDKEIMHMLCHVSGFAKSAALLFDHMNDEGTSAAFRQHVICTMLPLIVGLSDYSQEICQELCLTGFVAYLLAFLSTLDKSAVFQEAIATIVIVALTIILNCAKDVSTLQVFEAANATSIITSYMGCPIFNIVILGKLILGFLKSHLSNEEFLSLELDSQEALYLVTLLSDAVASPNMRAEGNSVEELLQFLINFTQPCGSEIEKQDTSQNKCSQFSLDYAQRKQLIRMNVQTIVTLGILSPIEALLSMGNSGTSLIVEKCFHLLWNLLHSSSIEALPASLQESLPRLISTFPTAESLVSCIEWLCGHVDKNDILLAANYAKSCFKYTNFEECVDVCKSLKELSSTAQQSLMHDVNLLHGKALYYTSQPMLWQLIKRSDSLSEKECRIITDECSRKMKEAITCLGVALDAQKIDSEGSKLLDFALNSFALDLGCRSTRCLLCRRGGQKLRNSHIWPNLVLTRIQKQELTGSIKPFLFGKNAEQPKFGKECTYYMFCGKCEELLSQNGESQFAKLLDRFQKDPSGGDHLYGSWLYNFAVGLIFRELTTEKMSYVVNEKELYNSLLLCRKHLFTLPVKVDNTYLSPYSEEEEYQFQSICADTTHSNLAVYLMNCPAKQMSSKDKMIHYFSEYCYIAGSIATCRLGDAKLDLSGRVHFLQVYLNGFHFLVKYSASKSFLVSDEYRIPAQVVEGQRCVIPVENVDSIPKGMWSVLRQLGSISFDRRMEFYSTISDLALRKLTKPESIIESSDFTTERTQPEILTEIEVIETGSSSKLYLPSLYAFTFLPDEFSVDVSQPGVSPLCLPKANKVVLHLSGKVGGELTSYFLCVNGSMEFFLIFLYCFSDYKVMDGVTITAEERPVVQSFLLEDRPRMERLPHPFSIPVMQGIVDQQLPSLLYSKGIKSMDHLKHLMQCRRSAESSSSKSEPIPSLDMKCNPEGCWYCKDLCHCCMHPVSLWSAVPSDTSQDLDGPCLKFCGVICEELVQPKPGSPPKVSATFNKKKSECPAKLQIVKSLVRPGDKFSRLEFVELCIGDGKARRPFGEPYVLWQIRSVTSQSFMAFSIDNEFKPLESLWTSKHPQLNMNLDEASVRIRVSELLENLLKLVLNKIGYESLNSFVSDNLPDMHND